MIKWNEVTWYSRFGAIILFVGIIPTLAFYIGTEYEKTKTATNVAPKLYENVERASEVSKLETLDFCGHIYQAESQVLFGVDMMKRIAELATAQPERGICKNITGNLRDPILVPEVVYAPEDASGIYYYLGLGPIQFSFNPDTQEIFVHNGFDGSPTLLGTFK
jgi:hypothetical protein